MNERKVALVTGGATGIGRAVAWRLAERGIDVVVNYSKSQADAEVTRAGVVERGANALVIQADVADEKAVVQMVAKAADHFGRIDCLVNNAAMTYFVDADDLEGMSADKWDRIYAVNVKGSFFCFRECVPHLKKHGAGAVVNISSVAALTGQGSCQAYVASKAALLNLTRSWARAFAPSIRCNAVLPGPVTTRWLMDGHQDRIASYEASTPMKRVADADDVAGAVIYFLLDSDFITGHWLVVAGGLAMP